MNLISWLLIITFILFIFLIIRIFYLLTLSYNIEEDLDKNEKISLHNLTMFFDPYNTRFYDEGELFLTNKRFIFRPYNWDYVFSFYMARFGKYKIIYFSKIIEIANESIDDYDYIYIKTSDKQYKFRIVGIMDPGEREKVWSDWKEMLKKIFKDKYN